MYWSDDLTGVGPDHKIGARPRNRAAGWSHNRADRRSVHIAGCRPMNKAVDRALGEAATRADSRRGAGQPQISDYAQVS